jgi:hypothetical protein
VVDGVVSPADEDVCSAWGPGYDGRGA